MAQDYTLNVKVTGVDSAKGKVDGLKNSVNQAGEAGSTAFNQLDKLLGGLPAQLLSGIKGLRSMAGGFKTLRAAIISTGIGALVVGLASLTAALTSSEEGQNRLNKIMGVLGSVVDNVMDKVADLGELIIDAFQNPRESLEAFGQLLFNQVFNRVEGLIMLIPSLGKALQQVFQGDFVAAGETVVNATGKIMYGVNNMTQVIKDAGSAIQEFGQEVASEANQAAKVADMRAKADKLDRKLLVERAQIEAQIAEQRLKARQEDQFGAEERKAALVEAQRLEDILLGKELKSLELRRDAQTLENTFARSNKENLDKEASAIAAVNQLTVRRLSTQRQTQRELNRVNREIERNTKETDKNTEKNKDAEKEVTKALRDAAIKRLDAQRQEEENTKNHYAELRLKAGENAEMILEIKESERLALQDIQDKFDKIELEKTAKKEAAIASLKMQAVSSTFSILKDLTDASEKDTEQSAKKAFNRNKAISVAETLVNTYMAAQKAYASQIIPLDPTSVIRAQIAAGIAVASGLAKVAAIKSTQFTGGGGGLSAAGGGGGVSGGPQSVGVDVGSLVPNQQNPTPEPVRAYVVENEISNKQALNRELQIQTTL